MSDDINQTIDAEVRSNDVVLFMKGTPQFPQCGFSGQVVQILDYLGVPYKGINVLESDESNNLFGPITSATGISGGLTTSSAPLAPALPRRRE